MTQYVDGVVANSNFTLIEHISRGLFPRACQKVIPDPVEGPSHNSTPDAQGPRLNVGFLGTFDSVKGLDTLAAVARKLRDHPHIRFVIGGNGRNPAYDRLVHESFPFETTTFLGWVDPHEFFRQVDVLVVPSLWREPYGRISIEARFHDVPPIVARSGGLPEYVCEGVDGFTFEAGNDLELRQIILRIFSDRKLLRRLSNNARAGLNRYSVDSFANELELFIDTTIAGVLSAKVA